MDDDLDVDWDHINAVIDRILRGDTMSHVMAHGIVKYLVGRRALTIKEANEMLPSELARAFARVIHDL